jgi:peptidyl-dipeptidase Dcp
MLLEKTYKGFVRGGAGLNEEDKEAYREMSARLSQLSLQFSQNVLAETNAFALNIPPKDAARVAELPDFVRESMAEEAKARGQEGWTVTIHAASMIPFLTYSSDRDLKEKVWRANVSKGIRGNENDNRDIVREMVELRLRVARILGYDTWADYILEERMARNVETVDTFLDRLLEATFDHAERDVATVADYARRNGARHEIMPWDFAYWSERYKMERYDVSEEEVKPYLKLESVTQGIFALCERLFGITFTLNPEIEVYHPDVEPWEAWDKDGSFLGVVYMDFFPRESKRGGAWMTSFRQMYTTPKGQEVRPLISMVCNFTKPTETTPSLLTFNEFTTYLHEFGHCLHGLFAQGRYSSLTGTSVFRDFVELPSQLMENWATEKEFLDMFATHYQTGERIPQELIDKIIDSKNYLVAYLAVRQLSFGLLDMAWHTVTAPVTMDVEEFEKRAVRRAQVLPEVKGTALTTSFGHIFSSGYSAGYYSYKWAEVLEADAYSLFQEKGIFSREVGQSFRDHILSRGGTEHPMTLYVAFRGHEPQIEALIEKMGLED